MQKNFVSFTQSRTLLLYSLHLNIITAKLGEIALAILPTTFKAPPKPYLRTSLRVNKLCLKSRFDEDEIYTRTWWDF